MSGIAGFVDFSERNLDRVEVLKSMLATVSLSNNIEAFHYGHKVALGMSYRLNTNSEVVPLNTKNKAFESANCSIVFEGTLYNEVELNKMIIATGYNLINSSTCELILASYEIWGLDCFEYFDGVYAVAIWDNKLQELILARDILGVQPLYYYKIGQTTCFGSTPKTILNHPEALAEVDIEGLHNIFSFVKTPGNGIFRNMNEVLPGTALRINKNNTVVHRYWSLKDKEHQDDLETTIENIQVLLEESISKRMSSASIQLSGGLDSSVILSIAASLNRKAKGDKIRTYSAKWIGQDFPNGIPSDFNLEEVNVRNMSLREDSIHTDIVVNVTELLSDTIRKESVTARDLPTGLGDMDTLYYLFYQGISNSSSKSISGEGADELFGGYSWFHDPTMLSKNKFPFSSINKYLETGDSSSSINLLAPDFSRQLNLSEFETENYRQALKMVPATSSENAIERRMREVCSMHMTHWTPILLDRRDRISRALGMDVHLPFCDKKLVEYVFNIPWEMKKFDSSTKSLLRAAATKFIPKAVAYQGKSTWVANQPINYILELRSKIEQILKSGKAPILQLLDKKLVKKLIDESPYNSMLTASAMGGALRLNQWLETYNVSIV